MQSKFKKRFLGFCASSVCLFVIGALLFFLSAKKSDIVAPLKLQRSRSSHMIHSLPISSKETTFHQVVQRSTSVPVKEYKKNQAGLKKNDEHTLMAVGKNHASSISVWVLCVGSFSNKKNAVALLGYLRRSHYNAYVVKKTFARVRGLFYRVMIGPELDKHVLKIIKKTLQAKGIKTTFSLQEVKI